MENRTYYILDYEEQIESVMNKVLSTQPDLIKVILYDSKKYKEDDPAANSGINPDFLPRIVEIAENYNLHVVAHIETEFDLKVALEAGIYHFAHPPYYGFGIREKTLKQPPRLSDSIMTLLKTYDSVVINPTLYRTLLNIKYRPKSEALSQEDIKKIPAFHRQLLKDLQSTGVTIAMGADSPGLTAVDEALYYAEIGAFSNREIIKMLIQTSTLIYPEAKVGKIKAGFQANLISTEKNPLEDLSQLENLSLVIKSGQVLTL
jgi:imidazolonepropionase-like amidohydrolase